MPTNLEATAYRTTWNGRPWRTLEPRTADAWIVAIAFGDGIAVRAHSTLTTDTAALDALLRWSIWARSQRGKSVADIIATETTAREGFRHTHALAWVETFRLDPDRVITLATDKAKKETDANVAKRMRLADRIAHYHDTPEQTEKRSRARRLAEIRSRIRSLEASLMDARNEAEALAAVK